MKSLELIHSLELKFLMILMKPNHQLLEKSIKLKKLKLLMIKSLILKLEKDSISMNLTLFTDLITTTKPTGDLLPKKDY